MLKLGSSSSLEKERMALEKAQHDLERQDMLLMVVNYIASLIMSAEYEEFDVAVNESLMMLGLNIGVERVYLWKNRMVDSRLCCSRMFEWSAQDEEPQELITDVPYAQLGNSWEEHLSKGQSVNICVNSMREEEQERFTRRGVISVLVIPIFIEKQFWGYIGFDDCKAERIFSDIEEHILQSAGLLVASAMSRNETTKHLMAMTEEALSSTRAKSIFLANMSHEIRTPMNAIMGMTTIAQGTNDLTKIESCLNKISDASKHLLNVINDVLDVSKIEAKKFELAVEQVQLMRLIENIRTITTPLVSEKRQELMISIEDNVPRTFMCDGMRLTQVVTNLLSNAIKFTPEEGTIRVHFKCLQEEENESCIEITVADNGIGIPEEKRESLFNAFEQADRGIARKFGGTGLGLSICKNIAELMKGDISIESEVGKGSTFIVHIRVDKVQQCEEGEEKDILAENEDYDFSRSVLLLVEDVEINRDIIIALLESTGIEIDCAENGMKALEMLCNNPRRYNIIFMDVQMPVMDGLMTTRKIRKLAIPQAAKIPIIAMTANAFAEDIADCIEAGMNDHVAKPINLEILLKKMYRYLKV